MDSSTAPPDSECCCSHRTMEDALADRDLSVVKALRGRLIVSAFPAFIPEQGRESYLFR